VDEAPVVKVAKTDPHAKMPTKGSDHAAGWDLYCLEDTVVSFRSSVKLRTGLRVAIPEGFEGQVRARSSLGSKGLILPHSIGTIDADYRGELFVLMTWIGEGKSYKVKSGERIAQLVIAPIPDVQFSEVDVGELGDTARGEGGFGSTGRF
jgi:dUTP pyrophosphatase